MNSYVKSLFIILILTLTSVSFSQFAGGDGSPGDPYQVADADGLYCVRFEPFAHYIQVADIDLSTSMWSEINGISWVPIDTFSGTYDGNYFKIVNLYIDILRYGGLFESLEGATLKNIILIDVNVNTTGFSGALSSSSNFNTTITNCSSSGIIQTGRETGGLIGSCVMTNISSCYSSCEVSGSNVVGGLVAILQESTMTDCYAMGPVTGDDYIGGLVGSSNDSEIWFSYSTGTVTSTLSNFGGLIGDQNNGFAAECFWDVETSGCATSAAGIGLPTDMMTDSLTFENWDFATPVWDIDSRNSGYPYLAWSIITEPFAGGTGTEIDPYQVATAEHLNNVRDHLDYYFIQIADIDLGVAPWNVGEGWVPIGVMEPEEEFIGSYNGDYHTISNLFIDNQDSYYENTGLFGFCYGDINNSTIENVILDSVNIIGFKSVGALIGNLINGNILNCSSSGTISAEESVGGLVGYTENSSNISGCYSTCNVTVTNNFLSGDFAGGLIGELRDDSTLLNSYASGSISGEHCVGGVIGFIGSSSMIENCYSTGFITGELGYTGGLVGFGDSMSEFYSYYDKDASGQDISFVGVGKSYSEMHNQSTYETWDFTTVWQMDPLLNLGYPYLAWSTPPVNNTPFAGGDGTANNPYLVATPTQLDSVRNHLSSYFKQISDIDLTEYLSVGNPGYNSGEFWQPIGVDWNRFEGSYDGNSKEINNFKINSYDYDIGLFSVTESGSEIKNLSIVNPDSINIYGDQNTGSIVGSNYGTISNCFSNCNVSGFSGMGGIVGNNSGIILQSYSTGNVIARDLEMYADGAGGLVGHNSGEIINCYARGKVTAKSYVGGLAGSNSNLIRFSYSSGKVIGETYTGGLIGSGMGEESYWDIETSGQPDPEEYSGRTHSEMLDQSTYDYSWDFTTPIWMMDPDKNSGYPYLAWSDPVEPIISFEDGDGTIDNPYQIATAEQLNEVRNHLDAYFLQVADIDIGTAPWNSGEGWLPIGDSMYPFTGYYDGGGYTISELTIDRSSYFDSVGLFGHIYGANIISLNLTGANINHSSDYTGIIAGSAINSSYIAYCSAVGEITSMGSTGGITGHLNNSEIYSCFSNTNNYSAGFYAGGLTGETSFSNISISYSRGTVLGKEYTGGFSGYSSNTNFTNCYSTALVNSIDSTYMGGFTGYDNGSIATSCYWNIESSKQLASPLGEGKTTSEMKLQSTYNTWDYTTPIWEIYPGNNNGYPYLEWEGLEQLPLFAGGDGTEETPYQIKNVQELQNMNQFLTADYEIMNNIDASITAYWNDGQGFDPIGNSNFTWFDGTLDGQNYSITNLYINRPDTSNVGLLGFIGRLSDIKGIGLIDANISGKSIVGGIIGFNSKGSITRCFSTGSIKGSAGGVGGLIGYTSNGIIENCYSKCNVEGTHWVGGLIGVLSYEDIKNCYSTGSVSAISFFGGLVGYNITGTATSSYWDTETSGVSNSDLGVGKTTSEMKTESTFSGWDFSAIWEVALITNDGYPFFMDPIEIPQNVVFNDDTGMYLLSWNPVEEATSYKIYGSTDPYDNFSDITLAGYFTEPTKWYPFNFPQRMFYRVISIIDDTKQQLRGIKKVKSSSVLK